jgi:hypothetical protein
MRAMTNAGRIFFKATASEMIFEAALTQKLTKWHPDGMPELIAVDTVRGRMLMLAFGVPDYRLEELPAIYENLPSDEERLLIDQGKGLTSTELKTLQDLTPRFRHICADLAPYGITTSLNQGDFHDGNTLIKNGRITFFDWGDANVTHPFVSLRTCFVSIERMWIC